MTMGIDRKQIEAENKKLNKFNFGIQTCSTRNAQTQTNQKHISDNCKIPKLTSNPLAASEPLLGRTILVAYSGNYHFQLANHL